MSLPAAQQSKAAFIRPDDRAIILNACDAIREACNRLKDRPKIAKKKKAA